MQILVFWTLSIVQSLFKNNVGNMDQQDCNNFFTTSTALDPPSSYNGGGSQQHSSFLGRLGHEEGLQFSHESVEEAYAYRSLSTFQF
jgi:hypothetical protein